MFILFAPLIVDIVSLLVPFMGIILSIISLLIGVTKECIDKAISRLERRLEMLREDIAFLKSILTEIRDELRRQ